MPRSCAFALALGWASVSALAAPPSPREIVSLCGDAEDPAHCGRLIEEVQLRRLPNLARRSGNSLSISLYPTGDATFIDSDDPVSGRSYSLWDFLDPINAVVLYSTAGESTSFILLRRTTNRRFDLPAEPHLSADRLRLVTADACPSACVNEIAVWRVLPDSLRKELVWKPDERWSDVTATWKDENTIAVEYRTAGSDKSFVVERTIGDAAWKRLAPN